MSSTSYVLAEYNNQTRKIQGQWQKKSYTNLMSEIRNKFSIDRNIDLEIKVYDKKNNKYFSIDQYEMNEIPKGGLIRIVKSKSRGTKKGSQPSKHTNKPPGVPPYSKQDDLKRNNWKVNSRVEIYSEGTHKWQKGQIVSIFSDNEGEWLVIKYAGFRTKEIQRFSNYVRPVQQQPQQPKKAKKPTPKHVPKNNTTAKSVEKKSDKKPEKVQKITTQSKYRKKEKIPLASTLAENQIHIKGNSQHIKKYIDRACVLLRGYDAGHKEADTPGDDDTKQEITKKYDVIELFGTGRAMGFVVSTAEIVKRIIDGLYQVTILESIQVTDVWQPLEAGLNEVETTKPVAQLKIYLAVDEKDIDVEAKGYQEPLATDDFAAHLEYQYDEDGNTLRVRSRGNRGGRGGKGGRGRGGKGGQRGRGRGRGRGKSHWER